MPDVNIPKSSLDKKNTNEDKKDRTKLEPVVKSAVKPKKKSRWERAKEEFWYVDGDSIIDYMLFDLAIPSLKKAIFQFGNNFLDMVLFGGNRNKNSTSSAGYVSYRDNSTLVDYRERNNFRKAERSKGAFSEFTDHTFESAYDAETVLLRMQELLRSGYPAVSIADYMDLSDKPFTNYQYNSYGWTNLNNVEIKKTYDDETGRVRYFLDLPRPMELDNR